MSYHYLHAIATQLDNVLQNILQNYNASEADLEDSMVGLVALLVKVIGEVDKVGIWEEKEKTGVEALVQAKVEILAKVEVLRAEK